MITERRIRKINNIKEKIDDAECSRKFIEYILQKNTVIVSISVASFNQLDPWIRGGEGHTVGIRLFPYLSEAIMEHAKDEVEKHLVVLHKELRRLMRNDTEDAE